MPLAILLILVLHASAKVVVGLTNTTATQIIIEHTPLPILLPETTALRRGVLLSAVAAGVTQTYGARPVPMLDQTVFEHVSPDLLPAVACLLAYGVIKPSRRLYPDRRVTQDELLLLLQALPDDAKH